jgi:hypothetical protein
MINKVILYQLKPQEIQHCSMLKVGLNIQLNLGPSCGRLILVMVSLVPIVQFELYDIILIKNGSYRNVM